jgi:hypothetical protein
MCPILCQAIKQYQAKLARCSCCLLVCCLAYSSARLNGVISKAIVLLIIIAVRILHPVQNINICRNKQYQSHFQTLYYYCSIQFISNYPLYVPSGLCPLGFRIRLPHSFLLVLFLRMCQFSRNFIGILNKESCNTHCFSHSSSFFFE